MMEIITSCTQNSEEWFTLRLGSVGGSSIPAVMAKGAGKMRTELLYSLAAEIITGVKTETYRNKAMERGHQYEPTARAMYEFLTGAEVQEIALIKSDMPGVHVSPDGLVGEDGGIEIKTLIPKVYLRLIDTKKIDTYHVKQCQHFLCVSGRKWCDYIAYCPEMRSPVPSLWVKRLYRDEGMIKEIETEVIRFLSDLKDLIKRIQE